MHTLSPSAAAKNPGAHASHALARGAAVTLPRLQAAHNEELRKRPATQPTQDSAPLASAAPASHAIQELRPICGATVPLPHASGTIVDPEQIESFGQRAADVAPKAFEKKPGDVGEHWSSASATVPCGQSARCVVGVFVGASDALVSATMQNHAITAYGECEIGEKKRE